MRAEIAAEMLAILASQEYWHFGVWTLPGYSGRVRQIAAAAIREREPRSYSVDGEEWRCGYAAAELVLRGL